MEGNEWAVSVATGLPLVEIRNEPPDEVALFSDLVLSGSNSEGEGYAGYHQLHSPAGTFVSS